MCMAHGGRGGSAGTREGASAALHRRQGGNHGSCADHTTGARQESHGRVDRGRASSTGSQETLMR